MCFASTTKNILFIKKENRKKIKRTRKIQQQTTEEKKFFLLYSCFTQARFAFCIIFQRHRDRYDDVDYDYVYNICIETWQ
jgi:hypothetical protein